VGLTDAAAFAMQSKLAQRGGNAPLLNKYLQAISKTVMFQICTFPTSMPY
jgi:hypothetical protein